MIMPAGQKIRAFMGWSKNLRAMRGPRSPVPVGIPCTSTKLSWSRWRMRSIPLRHSPGESFEGYSFDNLLLFFTRRFKTRWRLYMALIRRRRRRRHLPVIPFTIPAILFRLSHIWNYESDPPTFTHMRPIAHDMQSIRGNIDKKTK